MNRPVADNSARAFNEAIADPEVFCGGGSVAALAAAGAAATALLVMRLNSRRRSNAPHKETIERAIERTEALIDRLYEGADRDIQVLDELLAAQREQKRSGDSRPYVEALRRAAESPLELGEHICGMLTTFSEQLDIASRFTASDIGAAAALAEGACRAALLTAEVNIALLRERDDVQPATVRSLEERRDKVLQSIVNEARQLEQATRLKIHGEFAQETEQP